MLLFERKNLLEELEDFLASCRKGVGQLVLVNGAPGTGKTWLIHVFSAMAAADGARLLTATASYDEREQPLGVIRQLVGDNVVPPEVFEELSRCHTAGKPCHDHDGSTARQCGTEAVHRLFAALAALAEEQPLVLVVDDAHLMDHASVMVLLYLLRRIRSHRILVVCASWQQSGLADPLVHCEITRQPHQRIQLKSLTEAGVAELLGSQMTQSVPSEVSRRYHRVTAGNPKLVQALFEDNANFAVEPGGPAAGRVYQHAVLACLYQGEPRHLQIARAIAAQGELATARTTGLLVSERPSAVAEIVAVLTSVGVLDGFRFRLATAASAVLDDLGAAGRSVLHGEIARLLYLDGTSAWEVAAHLVAADQVIGDWGLSVLRQAAEQALARDNIEQATNYLRLALRECRDDQGRASLSAALARVEWQVNPVAAGLYLAPLHDAVLDGSLKGRDAATVLRHMLWQGDTEKVAKGLAKLDASNSPADARAVAELEFARHWFYGVSRVSQGAEIKKMAAICHASVDAMGRLLPRAATLVSGVATDATVADAVQALRSCRFNEATLEIATTSLLVIAYADRTAIAVDVCEHLMRETKARGATTWLALLSSIRGEIAMLQGDVKTAVKQTTTALELLPAESWGVLIGLPLSTAVLAHTAMGQHGEAAELLRRWVPDTMFQTTFGVRYLRARGHHHLATNRAGAAVNDFETCSQLMRDRSPGMQKMVPWRIDLAEANLRIGNTRVAQKLAEKQLELPKGLGSRTRAVALRTLARTGAGELRHRAALLRESIDLLQACGDRLELFHSLADLSSAYHELGDFATAKIVTRCAAQQAKVCNIPSAMSDRVDEHAAASPNAAGGPAESSTGTSSLLSDAENRVAALAALGYTNREIGGRIHVTVSTVEQHLTRVYRKLNVSNRTELPAKVLEFQIPMMADTRNS